MDTPFFLKNKKGIFFFNLKELLKDELAEKKKSKKCKASEQIYLILRLRRPGIRVQNLQFWDYLQKKSTSERP